MGSATIRRKHSQDPLPTIREEEEIGTEPPALRQVREGRVPLTIDTRFSSLREFVLLPC